VTPERLLVAVMHSIIDTTRSGRMYTKHINDYLSTDEVIIERFAWWPVHMTNGKRVLFKKYVEVRRYVDLFGHPPMRNNFYSFYWTKEDHLMNVLKNKTDQTLKWIKE
jgi:hypothetical protein